MSQKPYQRLLAMLVALTFLLCSSHALAGIIVTEGKISRCALSLTNAQALWNLGEWPDDPQGCRPPGEPSDEDDDSSEDTGHDFDEEDEDLDLDEEELGDLDSTPEGYTCSDLGNGLELCEEDDEEDDEESDPGQGAGAGSANGGAWLGYADAGDASQPNSGESVGGCQAAAPLGHGPLLALLALLGFTWMRRRRVCANAA